MSQHWMDAAALAAYVVVAAVLVRSHRRGAGFAPLTLAAFGLGAVIGILFRGHTAWVDPVGTVYVQVITAVVAPLVVVCVLASVTSVGSVAVLRTIGLSSVGWLLASNFLAILLTLGTTLALGLGSGVRLDLAGTDGAVLQGMVTPVDEVIVGLFPKNLAGDLQGNRIIPLVLLATAFAVATVLVARTDAKLVKPVVDLVAALRAILFKVVGFVIALTPYAVLALVATSASIALARLSTVMALLAVLVVSAALCVVHGYVVNGVLLRVAARVPVRTFFRTLAPAQLTAFTSQSSVGTLPLTLDALRRLGVPDRVASFTAPLGTTIGMPGCAGIWPITVAVFAINALGIPYGVGDYVMLVGLGLLVSLGTAGVPGTAIITATAVLTAAGLPVEVMVLLIPINAVAGTFSTAANVTAAATSAVLVAARSGLLGTEPDGTAAPAGTAPADATDADATDAELAGEPGLARLSRTAVPVLVGTDVPLGACEVR